MHAVDTMYGKLLTELFADLQLARTVGGTDALLMQQPSCLTTPKVWQSREAYVEALVQRSYGMPNGKRQFFFLHVPSIHVLCGASSPALC